MCSMNIFTEEMWFRLRKGIMDTKTVATFKVISKAKCIVSGLLSESVSKNYQLLKESNVAEEVHKGLYADLRSRDCAPENVNRNTIDADFAFVNDEDYIHVYQEEQSILRNKAKKVDEVEKELLITNNEKKQLKEQNDNLKIQLRQHTFEKLLEARKKAKRKFRLESFFYLNVKYIIWLILIAIVLLSISKEQNLGMYTIISGLASIIATIAKFPSKLQKKADKFRLKRYRVYIGKELGSM